MELIRNNYGINPGNNSGINPGNNSGITMESY
jgi:hypothetical protein